MSESQEYVITTKTKPQKAPKNFPWFWLVALLGIIAAYHTWEKYVETDKDGNLKIATWRKEKFLKDSATFISNKCEQYVLLAGQSAWYPCITCMPDTNAIFLNKGEVWYYGETCKEKKGRYKGSLTIKVLDYLPQFYGTKGECVVEQKRKIMNYPLLPENLARNKKLARPPANPVDN